MIVLPAVDILGGTVVRLTRGTGEPTVYGDDPSAMATGFVREGAEWLHVVDLDAALGTGSNRGAVGAVVEAVPQAAVQVGGGVRTAEDVQGLLAMGAARVVCGTEAVTDPRFLAGVLERGPERIVVAVDVDRDEVRIRGWTEGAGRLDEVLPRLADAGVRRLLVTSVARDGTMEGPDLGLYERVLARWSDAVIAGGGVRTGDDVRALAATGVEAAVVGRALYEGTLAFAEAVEAAAVAS